MKRSKHVEPANASNKPTSFADLRRKQANRESLGPWARVAVGALAAAVGTITIVFIYREPPLEEHPQYQEALRVLRNDNLESTDVNVRQALQLIDTATKPYSENRFWIVDPREWPPRCLVTGRTCRQPPQGDAKPPGIDDSSFSGLNASAIELEAERAQVWLIDNFITEVELASLLAKAKALDFGASPTNHQSLQEWRSSSSALPRNDTEFDSLRQRAAKLCGVPSKYAELPQVVRYLPGEKYKAHLDSEGPEHRHWTVLLYLSDPGAGGATAFPLLTMKVLPVPRTAILFHNLRDEGGVPNSVRNYYSLHDGQAPQGQQAKYAVNIWVRNQEYREEK